MCGKIRATIVFAALFFLVFHSAAYARNVLDVETNMSLWWTVWEDTENGARAPYTSEEAAQAASGFNLKQGRVILRFEDTDNKLGGYAQIRLEERTAILDLYGMWEPFSFFKLYLGQMKVPSTYEVLTSDAELDFISRTTLSENITDWSLSRALYFNALYGIRSYLRDTGIAVKGTVGPESNRELFSYFLMMSNGLGANSYIGGDESKEFLYSNDFGNYFYGARLDVSPIKWLKVGGHYSRNYHENVLFNDQKTVFDINRWSWSADARVDTRYFRLAGMYGAGQIDDDYLDSGLMHLVYSGWEAKGLVRLWKDRVECGVRYDTYTFEQDESDNVTDRNNWTFGLNVMPVPAMRIQVNYMIKDTENDYEEDIDDNIFYINFQYRLGVRKIIGSSE